MVMVCCAYRASRWFGGGPASYVEGCATIDNTDPARQRTSHPSARAAPSGNKRRRQNEDHLAGIPEHELPQSVRVAGDAAERWVTLPNAAATGCPKSAHALSEPGSTFIDASLPAYELVQGFGSWNWHPPLAPGSRNGTRKRFRHLVSIPDALSITAQRNGKLQQCGSNLPNDYAHPNPFRLPSRSFCTTLHSKLSHSRSSKCRSCRRITGSPDFTSTATQHRCERGSSTISTLRTIAPHRRRCGIRTKRELGVKPESASGKVFNRRAASAKEPFSGEVAPIASFSAIGFNPAAVRHTFNRLCPSTPAATSISCEVASD